MDPASFVAKKAERRKYFRTLQKSFSAPQYEQWNDGLAEGLHFLGAKIPPGALVAVYHAKTKEADLAPLFSLPLRFCFPAVLDQEGLMEFREVERVEAESFRLDNFGIMEPLGHHPVVEKRAIHTAFVPLLAFDDAGGRLGQGKGFYDRFLAGFAGQVIGVAFEWQRSPAPLPLDGHDRVLQAVVTEHGVRRFT